MNLHIRPLLSVLLLSGLATATGCSSSPKIAEAESTAPSTEADSTTPPSTEAEFASDAPTPEDEDQYASLVNLYGEMKSTMQDENQPQGRANLAQVSFAVDGACFDPHVDRGGTRLAFASTMHSSTADIYLKNVGGTTVTQVTSDPADDVMPSFSPEGDRIAFASNRAGKWDVYVTSISGDPPAQITNDTDHEIHPTWSPDGSMIAYCKFGTQSGRWEIWTVELDNPGVRRFLTYGMFPKWSPDVASSKILFQRPRQRGSRLHGVWTIDYVNGEALHPTEIVSAANAAIINPSWSPDGQRIVFVTVVDPDATTNHRPELSDIWVVNVDGSGRVRLTDGQFANYQPVWSTDGRVYFVSNRSGLDNVWAVAADRVIETVTSNGSGLAGVDPSGDAAGSR